MRELFWCVRRATVLGVGLSVLSCSGDSGGGPAACVVQSLAVSPASATIELGATTGLNATVTQQNCGSLATNWSSDNPGVASVASDGTVTGVAVGGPVTITASAGGKSGTATVTVTVAAVANVSITRDYENLTTGSMLALGAVTKDARGATLTGRAVTWSSSNPAIADASSSGVLSGVALGGPVTITATSEGKSATMQVSVVPRYAYAFANSASATAPYDAPAASSYSSVGAPTTITRSSAGTYTARFRGMAGDAGHQTAVLVNAFGPGNATCKIASWIYQSGDLTANVRCLDVAGALSDQQFFITVMGQDAFPGRFGFAWANDATAPSTYVPNGAYAYNASGSAIQITRVSTGVYSTVFVNNGRAAGTDPAETFLATAYGTDNVRCEIGGWSYSVASVTVRCTDPTGTPTDSRFVLVMLEQGRPSQRAAVSWVNCLNASCTPAATWTRNSAAGAITVTRTASGRYSVTFPGQARLTGADNVQLTSYGSGGGFCKLQSIANSGTDLVADVTCFGPGASVADRMFDIAVVP